jgi:hypothetical protein
LTIRVAVAAGWLLAAAIACSKPAGPGGAGGPAAIPGYRAVRDVRLPGDTSRWDYQVYDPSADRLYIAHLGASQVATLSSSRAFCPSYGLG